MKHRIGFLVAITILGVSLAAIPASKPSATTDKSAKQVTRVEQITGPAAVAYLQAKLASDAAIWNAYQTSAAQLRARGFKQTNEVVIVRRYRPPVNAGRTSSPFQQLLRRFVPSLHAQTVSESNSDGEVIYTSWDDGNDETWEGEQFFQDYSDGYWELTNLQEDIVEDPIVRWATLVGSRDGRERIERGGSPASLLPSLLEPSEEPTGPPTACAPSLQPALLTANNSSPFRLRFASGASQDGPYGVPCQCECSDTRRDRFCIQAEIAMCHVAACGAAIWPCRKSGPFFKPCMVFRCGNAAIACVIASKLCYRERCGY